MNNQKHTFGPWDVTQHSWREISINSQSNKIAFIDVEICFDVDEDNQDDCESIALANANLIAAAPDLLEALESVIADLKLRAEVDSRGYRVLNISDGVLLRAGKAIAKAIGKSHE